MKSEMMGKISPVYEVHEILVAVPRSEIKKKLNR